jgi:hypothetical protein
MCLVAVLATVARAEVLELEGTVKAVDTTTRTMSVERKTPKGTKTLELEVNKKAGDLSSVKVGDRITFSYDPDLELVTKLGGGLATPKVDEGTRWDSETLLKEIQAAMSNLEPKKRDALRLALALVYAEQGNYDDAKRERQLIEDNRLRDATAQATVPLMARNKNYQEARDLAASVKDANWHREALLSVLREELKLGHRDGHEKLIANLLDLPSDSRTKTYLRTQIAAVIEEDKLRSRLLAEAFEDARTQPDEITRDAMLQQILEIHLRNGDFGPAQEIAPLISEGRRKWGYANVARAYYRNGRVGDGNRVLKEGAGVDWQSHLPIERAIAEAGGNELEAIEGNADRMKDSWKRFESMVSVGLAYADRGDGDRAAKCLGKVARLIPSYQGNQRIAAETQAVDLAYRLISKGIDDHGLGIRIARDTGKMRDQRLLRVFHAYVDGSAFGKAFELINTDLEHINNKLYQYLAKAEVRATKGNEMPHWISRLESSSDRAWAYLGCYQALNEASASVTD